jgi:uncharacterized protein
MRAIVLAGIACLLATAVHAQSFNCRYAKSADEIMICQDQQLSALDEQMSSLYYNLRNSLGGYRRAALEDSQGRWLRGRISCGRDRDCIYASYVRRINFLQSYE